MTAGIMAERHTTEAPPWTIGRVLAWTGAALVALVVVGFAAGVAGGALDQSTGTHVWSRRIGATVPLLAFAIFGIIGWLALRRRWPQVAGPDADAWQRRAATRARRTMAAWFGTVATLAMAGMVVAAAAWAGVDRPAGIALLIGGVVLGVISLLWGTLVYMRVIDEQERQANLVSAYAGLTTYMVLFLGSLLLDGVGIVLPATQYLIFGAVTLVTTVTFLVARFR